MDIRSRIGTWLLVAALHPVASRAQNIGINVNGAAPHNSALLDIDASAITGTKRGLLIPRMTSAERVAILTPATGLLVFDTSTNGFWYFNGTIWVQLLSSSAGWALTGNAGTVAGTHFIGTVDNVPLEVRVNDERAGSIATGPMTGVGGNTSLGYQALDLNTTGTHNSAFGFQALMDNTTGYFNTAVGVGALRSNTAGNSNTAVGRQALEQNVGYSNSALGSAALMSNTGGVQNTGIGMSALTTNTLGSNNTGVGSGALFMNTTGNNNTALGQGAMISSTVANGNTGLGANALANSIGNNNTAAGHQALQLNTTGNHNNALGYRALRSTTTGLANCAFGADGLLANTTGTFNNAFGHRALASSSTAGENCAFGSYALELNTASSNSAFGYRSLSLNTSGSENCGSGSLSLAENTSGSFNSAHGVRSLYHNTTGSSNTAIGYIALEYNTTGTQNAAGGSNSLRFNTIGSGNTAWGANTLTANIGGDQNTAVGQLSMLVNLGGDNNTALGYSSMSGNIGGNGNVALGSSALALAVSGNENTAVGRYALGANGTGNWNTGVGAGADVLSAALNRATAIGYNAKVGSSNSLVLGGTGADAVNVGIGTATPTIAGLQVERTVGNTAGLFRANTTSQGVALVTDWPGIYLNCYYNGTAVTSMAGTGYPAVVNSNQSNGGILFNTTSTANTAPNTTVVVPERMRITGGGNVGIGTTTPAYLLEVNGAAAKPGGGTWTASSDARLKQDVAAYEDGLSELLRIRPVRYRYNALSGHDTTQAFIGVIAQELEAIAPYMVGSFNRNGIDYLHVDNSALIYMLVNAVKEQQVMIGELRERLVRQEVTGSAER